MAIGRTEHNIWLERDAAKSAPHPSARRYTYRMKFYMGTSTLSYCPSCGKKLELIDITDVNATGYKCQSGHYLHLTKHEVLTGDTMGSYLELKSGKESLDDIFREWLSNPKLRNHLNDSLANVLRFIVEKKSGKQIISGHYKYDFCPTCGNSLRDMASDDLYVAFLKCKNDHSFLTRNGMRRVGTGLSSEVLQFDFDRKQ